jgi:hypothetical protein
MACVYKIGNEWLTREEVRQRLSGEMKPDFEEVLKSVNSGEENTIRNEVPLFSKESQYKEEITDTKKLLRKIRENLQDETINVRKLQEKNNLIVTDASNIDWAHNQKNSRAKEAIKKFDRKEFRPIIKDVKILKRYGKEFNDDKYVDIEGQLSKGKITQEEFDSQVKELDKNSISRYLIAKHAPERNASLYYEKNPDKIGMPIPEDTNFSGMTDKEANELVQNFEQGIPREALDNLWSSINKANNDIMNKWVAYGRYSGISNVIKERNWKYYVPLRGWEKEYQELEQDYAGKGVSGLAMPKEAKGRTSLADNPLANMYNMAQTAIFWGEKNRVKQAAVKLAMLNKDRKDLFYLKKISYLTSPDKNQNEVTVDPKGDVFEITGNIDNEGNPEMNNLGNIKELQDAGYKLTNDINKDYQLRKPASLSNQHEVDAYLVGQKYKVIFPDANIANEINGMYKGKPIPDINIKGVKLGITVATRTLAKLRTAYSVIFGVRNPVRDFEDGVASTFIQRGSKEAALFAKNWPIALAQTTRGELGKESGKYMKYWDEFTSGGGKTGSTSLQSIEDIATNIDKLTNSLQHPTRHAVANAMKVWKAVDYLTGHLETTSRYAAYISARENGASIPESINAAKEVTVNFDRKGNWSSTIGSFVNFYNASIQGATKQAVMAKNHPYKYFLATGLQLAAFGYATAYLYDLYNKDRDKEKDYKKPNKYTRYNNMVIGFGNHNLSIPIAQGYRMWNAFGVISHDLIHGKIDEETAIIDALENIQNAMSPVEMGTMWNKDEKKLQLGKYVLRQISIVEPLVQLWENKDYAGRRIFKEPFTETQKSYTPDVEKYLNNTNPVLIGLAQSLWAEHGSGLPGTNVNKEGEKISDPWDLNPAAWDFMIRQYGGGLGTILSDGITSISKATWAKTKEYEKNTPDQVEGFDIGSVPFVNAFYRNKSKGAMYEEFKKVNQWHDNFENRYKALEKTNDPVKMLDEMNTPNYKKWKAIDEMLKNFDQDVMAPKKKVEDQKYIDLLNKERDMLMNDIIEKYNEK